jgi:formate dehydrogenase subunit delta
MDPHKLVKMANQIASYFETEPDRSVRLEAVAGHLKRFWDPRMRRELLRWQDEHQGDGLKDTVRDAIAAHRDKIASGV